MDVPPRLLLGCIAVTEERREHTKQCAQLSVGHREDSSKARTFSAGWYRTKESATPLQSIVPGRQLHLMQLGLGRSTLFLWGYTFSSGCSLTCRTVVWCVSAAGTNQLLFSTTNAGIAPGRFASSHRHFAHSQLPRAAVKLSLALRSHSGEITLPGLVGAWMLVAFSVKLPAGGGQFGAAFFRISTSTFWVMFLLLVWGRADNCGLLFWLDSTSSMLSTSFARSGTTALFLKNSAARNLLVAVTLLLVN